VGFTGRIVVARSDRPLSELTAVRGEVLEEALYPAGWRSVTLDGVNAGPGAELPGLVTETAAPALSALVMDSDLAEVRALTPGGVRWQAYLHEEVAFGYGAPRLDRSPDELVAQMVAWAVEAGRTPSEAGLRDALTVHNVFAEDTFAELLDALGITPPPVR
jgi:hypothetical protein